MDIEEIIFMYEDKIKRLSEDKSFGILNRNGLEEEILKIDINFNAIFLDFDGMHELNNSIGYENVNAIITGIFKNFSRDEVLIGRWFSGDEIMLIPRINYKVYFILKMLHEYIGESLLEFKYVVIENCNSIYDLRVGTNKKYHMNK